MVKHLLGLDRTKGEGGGLYIYTVAMKRKLKEKFVF